MESQPSAAGFLNSAAGVKRLLPLIGQFELL